MCVLVKSAPGFLVNRVLSPYLLEAMLMLDEGIPAETIDKPPSAELAPGQLDTDRLPDYTALDEVLDAYVERDLGRAELIALGHPAELVDAAPGLHADARDRPVRVR